MAEDSGNQGTSDVSSSTDWIDSFLKGIPDITSGLSAFTQGLTEKASGELTVAQGEADTAIYTQYLKDFPQYETFKENTYKTQENQTLADRLANMGMRGQTVGGDGGAATSASAAYTGEKSLWDQGYTALQNQLALDKTTAEQKLKVAGATVTAGKTEAAVGSAQELLGATATGAAIGSAFGPVGTAVGAAVGFVGDAIAQGGHALGWW